MREDLPDSLKDKLERLPDRPGIYRMRDETGTIIYVGKSRALRARVRSYFQESANHPPKVALMVSEVKDLDYIITGSDIEALILENNLIKEHRPRFNVMLRDDKNFPYLKLTAADPFPRVVLTRRPRPDKSLYFGPFLPASHAWRTLRMIPRFFQVANCHLRFDGRQRPCLYYHLDQCLAPCAGKADPAEYAERVKEVKLFLEGKNTELVELVQTRMREAAARLEFERAARFRDQLKSLEALTQRQNMTSVGGESIDFWAEYREGDQAAVELFRMREGRVIGRREFTFEEAPPPEAFYETVLVQFYADEEVPAEVILPRIPAQAELIGAFLRQRRGRRVELKAPRQGEVRRFLDLVAQNAKFAFEARFRAPHSHGVQTLEELRDLLGLDEAPFRIEGFDVSHLQGTEPRASLVVFEGGRAKKEDYRIFKVKSVPEGNDDFRSMREVVGRRYARLLKEGKRLPDLILIDGGKGQLGAAVAALKDVGLDKQPVIALAKREEEIFLEGRGEPILLGRHEPALQLIQQIRDEAHRFAIKHHRQARAKRTLSTALTGIAGVGPTTAKRLLSQFGSLEGVRAASEAALAAAIGPARAKLVKRALVEPPAGG